MKTRTIVATLLIVAAASADARFASPYPRKAVSPDDVGHWIVVTSNPWSHAAQSAKKPNQIRGDGRNSPPAN